MNKKLSTLNHTSPDGVIVVAIEIKNFGDHNKCFYVNKDCPQDKCAKEFNGIANVYFAKESETTATIEMDFSESEVTND